MTYLAGASLLCFAATWMHLAAIAIKIEVVAVEVLRHFVDCCGNSRGCRLLFAIAPWAARAADTGAITVDGTKSRLGMTRTSFFSDRCRR